MIELLITMVLSLAFVSSAVAFLISTSKMQNVQSASVRVQENARFALDELGVSIRMAGYYDNLSPKNAIPNGQIYTGPCGSFTNCTADASSSDTFGSDRIAILFNPPEDDGTDGDCIGNPISDDIVVASQSVIVNQFRILSIDGENSLVCDSYLITSSNAAVLINATPYELVPGIDAMHFLYGKTNIDHISDVNTNTDRYLSAAAIDKLTPPKGSTTPWVDIRAIRIALLASTNSSDKAGTVEEQAYHLLNAPAMKFTDRNFRKVYTSTVQINNARF